MKKRNSRVVQLLVDVWWHLPSTNRDCAGGHDTGSYPLLAVSPVFPSSPAEDATWCRCWRIHLSFSRKMFIGGLSWQTSPGMCPIPSFKSEISIFVFTIARRGHSYCLNGRANSSRIRTVRTCARIETFRQFYERVLLFQTSVRVRPLLRVVLIYFVLFLMLWSDSGWAEIRYDQIMLFYRYAARYCVKEIPVIRLGVRFARYVSTYVYVARG